MFLWKLLPNTNHRGTAGAEPVDTGKRHGEAAERRSAYDKATAAALCAMAVKMILLRSCELRRTG